MGKNSRSRSSVSQAKYFVLGAGLVLVLATVLPVLAQQNPGGGGAPPPGGGGSGPTINLPSLGNLTTPGLPFTGSAGDQQNNQQGGGQQGGQQQPQKGSLINVPDASGILKDALKQAQQQQQQGEEEGTGAKDFSGALKKADVFGKRGIAPLPFKKGKTSEEGTEMMPSETSTEAPTGEPTGEEGAPSRRPQVKGRPTTERLDKLPGFSRGVGEREDATTKEGASSPQLFDPKQHKQFVDKDLMKLFGKKPVKPAIQLPEIEEGGGLEEDAQVFGQYIERLIKAGRKLSKKSLRQNAIGFYSQVSKWCADEEVDCGDELNELKYAIRKGSKKDLSQTLSETWQAIHEKVLSGGEEEEEEEEEFFEE